ncbi:MAG: 4-hydroxythreonine-4-phosphate dehydrogenase PdxA [Chitinophagaceae bacterium]|nr:4-hydroxythreonine-4-phosphate dehydrogenase PdxA [Chitinophagaceae bacterium]MCW5926095.1 4-hydroxythreonine-4-phosphate dehydrogenase PdxA [Chitinophagaceae bacterium]
MLNRQNKPVIGISCGDLNGIGIELIIKTFSDNRMLEFCTPVVFASNKVINFYKKTLPEINFSFQVLKDIARPFPKQVNIYNCWDEDVNVTPGQQTEAGGKYAVRSLAAAVEAFKAGHIQGLITAPMHKNNVQSESFRYTGHTPYLKDVFGVNEVVMLMCAENMRVGLLTEHVPVKDVAAYVTRQAIVKKLQVMRESLQVDFGIDKPRIAVLGLNPHAGDDGLIGKEEEEQIKPAIKEAKQNNILVFGPYSADAFFARGQYEKFDAVLAMYHDQGLIPFKSLALGEGTNYTAGLPLVRTSPDHGTAFDIAGKNKADETSFRQSVFFSVERLEQRAEHAFNRSNPMKRMSVSMLTNAEDEKIDEG